MDQMTLTYIIAVISGIYSVASIIYYKKNKRFIGRRVSTTFFMIIVFFMSIFAIIKGIPLTQLQFLIESMFR